MSVINSLREFFFAMSNMFQGPRVPGPLFLRGTAIFIACSFGKIRLHFRLAPAPRIRLVNHPRRKETEEKRREETEEKTSTELYDKTYWAWQEPQNEFGGVIKGDAIRHLIPEGASSILEFGASGGAIIGGMPYQRLYAVEVNPAARKRLETRNVTSWERTEDISEDIAVDFLYSTSVLEHVECPVCEVRKFRRILSPKGAVAIGVKHERSMSINKNDINLHIYETCP